MDRVISNLSLKKRLESGSRIYHLSVHNSILKIATSCGQCNKFMKAPAQEQYHAQ